MIRGTGLYELWKTGKYRNYTPDELVDLVAKVLALVPPWTRVYRIQRCVPNGLHACMRWTWGVQCVGLSYIDAHLAFLPSFLPFVSIDRAR